MHASLIQISLYTNTHTHTHVCVCVKYKRQPNLAVDCNYFILALDSMPMLTNFTEIICDKICILVLAQFQE